MMGKTIRIGRWNVPQKLFDDYILWSMRSDGYLLGKLKTPSGTEYEKHARWLLCSKRVMELHREICEAIGVEYSSAVGNEFYEAFHKEFYRQTRLKG